MADYSSFIYNAISGAGDPIMENRQRAFEKKKYSDALLADQAATAYAHQRDAVKDSQWQQSYGLDQQRLGLEQRRLAQGEIPADARDYLFARKNGFQGSYQDWKTQTGTGNYLGTPLPVVNPDGSFGGYALPSKTGDTKMLDPGNGRTFMGPGQKAYETKRGSTEGGATGDAVASYNAITSKLPGLTKVVGELGKLANSATYTSTGQAVDWFNKEAGLAPRQGAIDRTRYQAMVSNQILPMLRDTFGAQFTAREGDTLAATLGDPNKTPQEKQAVLESFIEQKYRDAESYARQAGMGGQQPPGGAPQAPAGGGWSVQQVP